MNEAMSPQVLSAMHTLNFFLWQKRRRTLTRAGLGFFFLAVVLGFVLVTIVYEAVVEGLTVWGYIGTGIPLALYSYYVIGWPLSVRRILRKHSRGACIHAAEEGVLHLESNDPVKASWYVERLLTALADMLKERAVAVVEKPVSPRSIMVITPESIPRRAVLQVIQENESAQELQVMLDELGQGLQRASDDDPAPGYVAASAFLNRLHRKTEPYHRQTRTFFDRHPILVASTRIVGPVLLVLLSGLAAWLAKL